MEKSVCKKEENTIISLNLLDCSTQDISDYLDYFMPILERKYGIKITKVKRFSFKLNFEDGDCYFNLFSTPLDYNFNSYQINSTNETVCVFYLFNYFNSEQLGLGIESFIGEVVLKGKLRHISGKKGYYDIRFSKHFFISAYQQYEKKYNENLQYYYFKDTLASRKTVFNFKNLMEEMVVEICKIPHLTVERAIQSVESEAFYISVIYQKGKVRKNMKISVRNHPISTKAQMCFYAHNYNNLIELRDNFISAINKFNWEDYVFTVNSYYDVKPSGIYKKKLGHDLKKYSREQREFILSNKQEKNSLTKINYS